jgi:hypothetical protein
MSVVMADVDEAQLDSAWIDLSAKAVAPARVVRIRVDVTDVTEVSR